MKKLRKMLLLLLTVVVVAASFAGMAMAAEKTGWVREGDYWYYKDANGEYYKGWKKIDGKTYFFDEYGVMADNIYKTKNKIYLFENGVWQPAKKGWYNDKEYGWRYGNSDGSYVLGWKTIKGKRYLFRKYSLVKNNGTLMTNTVYHDNGKTYYLGDDGAMRTGWLYVYDCWYYFKKNGANVKGWLKLGGKKYYFNDESHYAGIYGMATGWQKIKGKWYYFGDNGSMVKGWQKIKGKWYYFGGNGKMVTGKKKIKGKIYVFNDKGVWVK